MKTLLAIIGGLALMFFVGIIALIAIAAVNLSPLQHEAKIYASKTVEAVATEWNGAALMARAAPEIRERLLNGVLQQMMDDGARMIGGLTKISSVDCNVNNFVSTNKGEGANAACVIVATHERGEAHYKVGAQKDAKDNWSITGFYINYFAADNPQKTV